MIRPSAAELITRLNLARHPEGGWYRETYRASGMIPGDLLPERCAGAGRSVARFTFCWNKGTSRPCIASDRTSCGISTREHH